MRFGLGLKVSVNLSAHQFMLDDLVERIGSILQASSLRPGLLKIDRSFVTGSESCTQKRSVIKAVITLAHGLDMKVIAEGVETEAQLKLLLEQGCDKAQGYLLGRPMEVEAVNNLLADLQAAYRKGPRRVPEPLLSTIR
jgi:EAL domain-containing protein (putative c-di-GMP-specific phosphodiesterase class I)